MLKKIKRRNFVTEKFGLWNILKAIDSLASGTDGGADGGGVKSAENAEPIRAATPAQPSDTAAEYNYMLGVLERHEAISNRLKKK